MGLTGLAWSFVGQLVWFAGALACLLAALWMFASKARYGQARRSILLALLLTAGWAASGALLGFTSPISDLFGAGRNLGWIFALYRLFAFDGRHASVRPVRPMLVALAFVELLKAFSLLQLIRNGLADGAILQSFHTVAMLHELVAVGGLVLLHNLYAGASLQARLVLRWPAIALAVLWIFDLNHYAIGYLADGTPMVLAALRGLVGVPMALLLVLGARESSDALRFSPSRGMAFQTASLVLIGSYLLSMVALAQWLAIGGGDYGSQLQFTFVVLATLAALIILPSKRLRAWLRVMLAKHFFQHRYDYRSEWIRFTRTIGSEGARTVSIEERAIRAVADITDSPAGLLLAPNEQGQFELAARWQWPTAEVPANALDLEAARVIAQSAYVADLDELRAGRTGLDVDLDVPAWLLAETRAWALVPLLHFERLVGLVVLARPPLARKLDWEDFDLLRVTGQQLASYLAEHAGQAALAEAARFDDFHRRIAFVMHDIKNLASQFSLLARNAELHAENPEFRADMLVTLRNSADKLNVLLSRLSRYGPAVVGSLVKVRADEVAAKVVKQFEGRHPVSLIEAQPCEVTAAPEELEQILLHLIQNAIDASDVTSPVFVRVSSLSANGAIEVVDSGYGMSAEFVRSRLFKPFDSTKTGGFGIGAYEARELVRAMNGRIDVESREGLGTRFIIHLPRADATSIIKSLAAQGKASKKVA